MKTIRFVALSLFTLAFLIGCQNSSKNNKLLKVASDSTVTQGHIASADTDGIEELSLLDRNGNNPYAYLAPDVYAAVGEGQSPLSFNLFDGDFRTSWAFSRSEGEIYIRVPDVIPADKLILNIFSGSGDSLGQGRNYARPAKIGVTVYSAFIPEGYVSETSSLYLLMKSPVRDTIVVLADSAGIQSFNIGLDLERINQSRERGLGLCKHFSGKEFSASDNSDIGFTPSLVLKLSVRSSYQHEGSGKVCISEIFFNDRFITAIPEGYGPVTKVYENDTSLIVDYANEKGTVVYRDSGAVFTMVEWVDGADFAVLHYLCKDEMGPGRVQENYLLFDLKNRQDVTAQFEKTTGFFFHGLMMKDNSGSVFIDLFTDSFRVELK